MYYTNIQRVIKTYFSSKEIYRKLIGKDEQLKRTVGKQEAFAINLREKTYDMEKNNMCKRLLNDTKKCRAKMRFSL